MNEQLTEKELNELANSPIWEHERLVGTGNQVKSLADEIRESRKAAKQVRTKCEQYWNEHNIGDVEVHAVLEFIHAALYQSEEGDNDE